MRVLRGDVPLEDMLALLESERKYMISSYLECLDCGRTWHWGLCVRGNPLLRTVDRAAVEHHRWETVPPREEWAGR